MKGVTNVAASIRQRLLNEAKRRGESFDYILSLYARERFLARLTHSPHRNRLVLKGASVFAVWLDVHRPSRDLDFLGSGNFGEEETVRLIDSIVAIAAEDGLEFDRSSITVESIREAGEYRGVRVHLVATLDTARIAMQIDIGLGDAVTPRPQAATLPVILDGLTAPRVKVYPPETIVAEKLHAMVKLGIANSRMKDFFDLYALASAREFDEDLLAKAVRRTFERRKTAMPEEAFALTEHFYTDRHKQTQWRAFLRKSGVEAPEDFSVVGGLLRTFLLPLLGSEAKSRVWRGVRWRS